MSAPTPSAGKPVTSMDGTEIVEHILCTKKNYYSLFQLPKTCTAAEVQAVYKKMALKCHPDKNKHPMALEAFKVLAAARDVLTNPEIRKNYGRPREQNVRPQDSYMRARRGHGGAGPYGGVDSFEQLFQQLFSGGGFFTEEVYGNTRGGGGGGSSARYYYTNGGGAGIRRPQHAGRGGQGNPTEHSSFQRSLGGIIMFLPLIMFVLMVFLMQSNWEIVNPSSYGQQSKQAIGRQGERLFSLTPLPDQGLVVRRTTSLFNTNVEYFVSQKHAPLLKKRETLVRIEREVLKEKKNSLERRCSADRHNNRAKGSSEIPSSCEEFRRLSQALG